MTIFVVDDDDSLRWFVKRWLARLTQAEVLLFDDGAAAVEFLPLASPCLLISDLDLPGLSGEEVAEAAARLPRPPRIVLMSGDDRRLEKARNLAQATLTKPFLFGDLRPIVESAPCCEDRTTWLEQLRKQ